MNHIGIFVTVFINQEYCFGEDAKLTLGVFFVKKAKTFCRLDLFSYIWVLFIHIAENLNFDNLKDNEDLC